MNSRSESQNKPLISSSCHIDSLHTMHVLATLYREAYKTRRFLTLLSSLTTGLRAVIVHWLADRDPLHSTKLAGHMKLALSCSFCARDCALTKQRRKKRYIRRELSEPSCSDPVKSAGDWDGDGRKPKAVWNRPQRGGRRFSVTISRFAGGGRSRTSSSRAPVHRTLDSQSVPCSRLPNSSRREEFSWSGRFLISVIHGAPSPDDHVSSFRAADHVSMVVELEIGSSFSLSVGSGHERQVQRVEGLLFISWFCSRFFVMISYEVDVVSMDDANDSARRSWLDYRFSKILSETEGGTCLVPISCRSESKITHHLQIPCKSWPWCGDLASHSCLFEQIGFGNCYWRVRNCTQSIVCPVRWVDRAHRHSFCLLSRLICRCAFYFLPSTRSISRTTLNQANGDSQFSIGCEFVWGSNEIRMPVLRRHIDLLAFPSSVRTFTHWVHDLLHSRSRTWTRSGVQPFNDSIKSTTFSRNSQVRRFRGLHFLFFWIR